MCHAILQAYPFDKEATVVLDYACGTGKQSVQDLLLVATKAMRPSPGIVARSLAPHCKTLIGVDISQGMVDEFNKGVQSHGAL